MEAGKGAAITSTPANLSGPFAGRKDTLPHVGNLSNPIDTYNRRQYSLSGFLNRMRLRWSTRSQRLERTMIPPGLSELERSHYRTLIDFVENNPERKPPRVVVITDLGKDYDDLAAMVVLKELHRLGIVKLVGFIANLMPAEKRAQFGRGALDSLGLQSIPIAQGTAGFPPLAVRKHTELPYEFACDFMATDDRFKKETGDQLLRRLCKEAIACNESLTLVLISSLEDIYTFSLNDRDLLELAVSNIVLQGGYTVSEEDGKTKLNPEESANNNRYDMNAAIKFHEFMLECNITSTVYTKVAAFATPLTSELFAEMAKTNHPIGIHLRKVQVTQDLSFYKTASNPNKEMRFAPFMDQKWFLENKTSWFDTEHAPNTPYPKGEEVVPWLTKVIVYDALAALGASGPDVLNALGVLKGGNTPPNSIHQIVGSEGPPKNPGVDPEQMASVLSALLKGSLLSCPQGNR